MPRPSLTFRVESTAGALQLKLRRLGRDQIPFATARALTDVAQLARDRQRAAMPTRFTIRNQRVVKGITMEAARKSDWPKTRALVGTKDAFMARFEEGGRQRPKGGRRFAVPTKAVEARRTKGGKIPKSLRPSKLIRGGRAVLSPDDQAILLKRKRKKTLGGLRTLFTLHGSIRLKRRLRLRKTVEEVMRRKYQPAFQRRLKGAIQTRK